MLNNSLACWHLHLLCTQSCSCPTQSTHVVQRIGSLLWRDKAYRTEDMVSIQNPLTYVHSQKIYSDPKLVHSPLCKITNSLPHLQYLPAISLASHVNEKVQAIRIKHHLLTPKLTHKRCFQWCSQLTPWAYQKAIAPLVGCIPPLSIDLKSLLLELYLLAPGSSILFAWEHLHRTNIS